MNYNLLTNLIKENNFTLDGFMKKIGITKQGFYYMQKHNSMPIKVLENAADLLKVTVCYFYGEGNPVNSSDLTERINSLQLEIAWYKDQIRIKDDQILVLNKVIQEGIKTKSKTK